MPATDLDAESSHHHAPPAGAGAAAPAWRERLALIAILALALGLRLIEIDRSGWGAEYYTAAVRSMAQGWHNFFFAAFDPAGFISVDKPPLALWLQVLSVKLLGFSPLAVILPQALAGAAAVAVLYAVARPRFGAAVGLGAALLLATTPIWVAVNRTNNTDSCLLLVLLLAGWALLKAAETGSRARLCLALALVGLGFNVKMLAACIVLPAFVLVYWLGAGKVWPRRLLDLCLAGLVFLATALPWVLAVELTPPAERPYIGSSRTNSMLELIVGHNASSRFISRVQPAPAPDASAPAAPSEPDPATALAAPDSPRASLRAKVRAEIRAKLAELRGRQFVRTPVGPLRLARGLLAAQTGWLWPLALAGLGLGLTEAWTRRGRGPRRPLTPAALSLVFWLGWLATYVAVYSALGGIIHFYYLSTLAPALAVLASLGARSLWRLFGQGGWSAAGLPLALAVTALWQVHVQATALGWSWAHLFTTQMDWLRALNLGLAAGALLACAGLVVASRLRENRTARAWLGRGGLALGLAALLVLPLAWTISAVLAPANGIMPAADLYRIIAGPRLARLHQRQEAQRAADLSRLVAFLAANRHGERFLLSSSTYQVAAPIIIATGLPVMARGGFHGLDPALDPERLAALAGAGQVRFVMLDDVASVSRRLGADAMGGAVAAWVRAHGRPVDPALWRATGSRAKTALFDLHPEAGLAQGPASLVQPALASATF